MTDRSTAATVADAPPKPSTSEAKAAAALADERRALGYELVEWKPGVFMLRCLRTHHTEADSPHGELAMRSYQASLAANDTTLGYPMPPQPE